MGTKIFFFAKWALLDLLQREADPTKYSESVQPLTMTIFSDSSIPELVLLDDGEPVLLDAEDLVLLDEGEPALLDAEDLVILDTGEAVLLDADLIFGLI